MTISKSSDNNIAKKIKYYSRLHNDNIYSLKSISLFEFEISKEEIKSMKSYYKVYYNKTYYYFAERFVNSLIKETYTFDSKGRFIECRWGKLISKHTYNNNQILEHYYENHELKSIDKSKYVNDRLEKDLVYNKKNELVEYTIYNYKTWEYQKFDKNNILIEKREMMRPGK